jgi:hypothetical protein
VTALGHDEVAAHAGIAQSGAELLRTLLDSSVN